VSVGPSTGGEAEDIEVTSHDTVGAYREFVSGFKSRAAIDFTIRWDPNLAAHDGLVTLYNAGTVVPVIIGLPTAPAVNVTFNAFISRIPIPALGISDALDLTITMTISGTVTIP
jgi:predicted secreted protein